MKEQPKKIMAIDIKRATTVAIPTGGGVDVEKGAVLLVPQEVSAEDAAYLIALGKAAACAPGLKAERARKGAELAKKNAGQSKKEGAPEGGAGEEGQA